MTATDLAGTCVFALEGALAAIDARLDLLGIVVIGFVAALGGGILRDVVIGAVPPAAFRHQSYPLAAIAGTVIAMLAGSLLRRAPELPLLVLDAAGLALFAVAGTQKALAFGIPTVGVVFLGTLTAVGGGAVRDVLLARVPVVLHDDFYATAAIIGSAVLLLARRCRTSMRVAALLGATACFAARMAGVLSHWTLPTIPI